ncbi:hypothetical protein [Coleofasciculus sp. H7-2]|uniref:hypothetical protein n=1 Tax=Coleofasciculus sp. H7-2 TaxID=3351545 RepID=UPI003672F766
MRIILAGDFLKESLEPKQGIDSTPKLHQRSQGLYLSVKRIESALDLACVGRSLPQHRQ